MRRRLSKPANCVCDSLFRVKVLEDFLPTKSGVTRWWWWWCNFISCWTFLTNKEHFIFIFFNVLLAIVMLWTLAAQCIGRIPFFSVLYFCVGTSENRRESGSPNCLFSSRRLCLWWRSGKAWSVGRSVGSLVRWLVLRSVFVNNLQWRNSTID